MNQQHEGVLAEFNSYLNAAYCRLTWRFLGKADGDVVKVISATLRFETCVDPLVAETSVTTGGLVAGIVNLDIKPDGCIRLARAIASGEVFSIAKSQFQLDGDERAERSLYLKHPWYRFQNDSKNAALQITGGNRRKQIDDIVVYNERLKADSLPFDDVEELLRVVGLPHQLNDGCVIDVSVTPLAHFSTEEADVLTTAGKATWEVIVPNGLTISPVRLGWRCMVDGIVIERAAIDGENLNWSRGHFVWSASHTMIAPESATLHCYLSVAGRVQAERTVSRQVDGNVRLQAYEPMDPNYGWLKSRLFDVDYSKRNSRDFEDAVAYLFFFLGFSGIHLGHALTAAPDLIAVTANGDIVVVECTIETYVSEKVDKLMSRASKIRKSVQSTIHRDRRVVPVMVTLQKRNEGDAWVKMTADMGAALVGSEDLHRLFDQAHNQKDGHLDIFEQLSKEIRPSNAISNLLNF